MLLHFVNFGRNNTHIQHVLTSNGVNTIEVLERTPDCELLRFINFGAKGLADARALVPYVAWRVWTPEMQEEEFQRERS